MLINDDVASSSTTTVDVGGTYGVTIMFPFDTSLAATETAFEEASVISIRGVGDIVRRPL